jgi:hypothetical protein
MHHLQGYSGKHVSVHGDLTLFETFLAAIKTAGLTEELASGGPYLVLAPTDKVFAHGSYRGGTESSRAPSDGFGARASRSHNPTNSGCTVSSTTRSIAFVSRSRSVSSRAVAPKAAST